MLSDKKTYWIEFSPSFNPKNSKETTYQYNTITAIISNDDFEKVSDRKLALINAAKDKLINWHISRKYKNITPKKDISQLVFTNGKVTATFKNFVAKRMDIDIL